MQPVRLNLDNSVIFSQELPFQHHLNHNNLHLFRAIWKKTKFRKSRHNEIAQPIHPPYLQASPKNACILGLIF